MTTRIRRGRELAGLTMGQAARRLGLTVTEVSDFELGRANPSPERYIELAKLYGVSLAWIHGATPDVPAATRDLLRGADLPTGEREDLLELICATQGAGPGNALSIAIERSILGEHVQAWRDFLLTVEVGGPIPITFELRLDATRTWTLHSTMLVPDRDGDDRCACGRRANDTPITIVNALPGPEVDKATAIRQRVLGHYQHEALEHIRIGGVRPFDPHEARWFSNLVADWRFNR